MGNHKLIKFTSALAFIATAGCTTIKPAPQRGEEFDTSTLEPVPAARGELESAGVFMAYEFTGLGDSTRVCRMRLIERETGKSQFIEFTSDKNAAFAPIRPGTYDVNRIGCGFGQVYDVDGLLKEGFKATAGKASYIGKFTLVYEDRYLSEVKKAARDVSAAAFEAAVGEVPADMPTVSGFTLGPIDRSMASESPSGFNVHADGMKNATSQLAPLVSRLQSCEKRDANADSLRLGKIEYTATYKSGHFIDFKDRKDASSLSDTFKSCVSDSMAGFHPLETSDVQISVVY